MGQSLEMCPCSEKDATKKQTSVLESVQGLRESELCMWGEEMVGTRAPVLIGGAKHEEDVSEQRVVSLGSACMMAGDNIEGLVDTEKTGDHLESDCKSTGSSSLHHSFGHNFSPRSSTSIRVLVADEATDAFRAANDFHHQQNVEMCGAAVASGRNQANTGDADKRSFADDESNHMDHEEAAAEMGAVTLQTPQGLAVRSRSRLCFGNSGVEMTPSESDPAEIAAALLLLRQKIVELRADTAAEELCWLPDGTLSPCSTAARFGEFHTASE